MSSKKRVRQHIQSRLDEGCTRKDFAGEMGFESPNYVSMLMGDNYPTTLLSPNRIESFAKACDLSDRETMLLALARLRDAGEKPVEMSADTLLFLLKTYGELVKERYVLTRRPT